MGFDMLTSRRPKRYHEEHNRCKNGEIVTLKLPTIIDPNAKYKDENANYENERRYEQEGREEIQDAIIHARRLIQPHSNAHHLTPFTSKPSSTIVNK